MRVLVTGAAGFIGSHFSERCIDLGYEVIAIDSLNDFYSKEIKLENLKNLNSLKSGKFRWIQSDVLHIQNSDLLGVDVIVHLAGRPGVRSSWGGEFVKYVNDNILGTQHLFELNKGLRPITYASSSVYGSSKGLSFKESSLCNPLCPYGVSKLAVDHLSSSYHERYGGTYIGARYFTVYGPRQRPDMAFTQICRSLFSSEIFQVFGDGRQIRHFTYIDDAVEATVSL